MERNKLIQGLVMDAIVNAFLLTEKGRAALIKRKNDLHHNS